MPLAPMSFETLLPYLVPPLLGAFIGYVTNHIAIRMLFRPLRPWRVLGVRVPLTPGIIPSKRGELAEKMGQMVGDHLLTAEDVGAALEGGGFRRELRAALAEKLDRFLQKDCGPLLSLVPERFQGRFRELAESLRTKAVRAVFAYLDSEDFERRLRKYLGEKSGELLARDLESFLTPERHHRLREHARSRTFDFLASDSVGRAVGDFIDRRAESLIVSRRPLRELLPAEILDVLLDQIQKEVPALLEKFGGMLYDPDFRRRLTKKGKEAIEGFLDSLGGLAGLLSGFVDMDKIYGRIPEFLDKAAEEIAAWLKEEKTQDQVAAMLRERIDAFLDRPLGSYLDKLPYEKVAGSRRFIKQKAVAFVQSPKAAEMVAATLEMGVERIKDRSFGSLLEGALPQGSLSRLEQALLHRILAALRSPQARAALESILEEKLEEWIFRAPIGRISQRLPGGVRHELEDGLFHQFTELLKKEVPPLVETLKIQKLVEQKVNSLDLLQVEGLLMGIMKEQFKYINLFGALLGGMIGLFNLLALRLL